MDVLAIVDRLLGIRKKHKGHKLKWKLPEEKVTFTVEDADGMVGTIEKKVRPRFLGGGEFVDTVYAKEFGDGVYGYLIVRTDKKTEDETLIAETYMLNEEEKLGIDLSVGSKLAKDFSQMGYLPAFEREFRLWKFAQIEIGISVYDVGGLGGLVEFSLPATNLTKQREGSEKKLFAMFEKLGLKKEEGIPTDSVTLQLMSVQQEAEEEAAKQAGGRKGLPKGGFKL